MKIPENTHKHWGASALLGTTWFYERNHSELEKCSNEGKHYETTSTESIDGCNNYEIIKTFLLKSPVTVKAETYNGDGTYLHIENDGAS